MKIKTKTKKKYCVQINALINASGQQYHETGASQSGTRRLYTIAHLRPGRRRATID